LRYKSQPVCEINAALRQTVREMFELMYAAQGIGLASNQVGIPQRFFILNLTADPAEKNEELVFVNPEIIKRKGTTEGEEGCLSFPGLYGPVKRSEIVIIEAFDLQGQPFELTLDELAARAVQHETDHLDGVLFIDRMTDVARRTVEPIVADYEARFRRKQGEGVYPSDDEIRRKLAAGG
jgi:peptide deformylase